MSDYYKCSCPHCAQSIEFPAEGVGQIIACPTCEKEVALISQDPSRFIPAKCPGCGGAMQVPANRDRVICMYCGAPVNLRQPTQHVIVSGFNVENLIELAQAAAIARNFEESYGYYTKILEVEPRNPKAWAGKGEAAGWVSTLSEIKTIEMITALSMSISYADECDKQVFQKHAADVINRVTSAIFGMAKKHSIRFVRVGDTWPDYVKQCGKLIGALEVGHGYDPENRTTLENILTIAKDNLEGASYSPDRIGFLKKTFSVTKEYRAILNSKVLIFAAKLDHLTQSR